MIDIAESNKKIKVLIIGYGSIGRKHELAFQKAGATVYIFSKRQKIYTHLLECLKSVDPQVVVIANKTSDHFETLMTLRNNISESSLILVEKPLFSKIHNVIPVIKQRVFTAYNLRQHILIQELKKIISKQRVISAHIYCGQYLPTWRPSIDYRKNYSAIKEQGGGVLRDLSHEIDYSNFLFGKIVKLTSYVGKLSKLEIETEDTVSILGLTQHGVHINLSVNYIDHGPQRKITVNTNTHTYVLDLIHGTLTVDGTNITIPKETDNTYDKQAKCLLRGDLSQLCSYTEGMEVLKTINNIEKSYRLKTWINN